MASSRAVSSSSRSRLALESFFTPVSVAVIGATEREGSVGRTILENLVRSSYRGRVFAVNPKRSEVLGVRCYPSVAALSEPVDLAVIVTPAAAVPAPKVRDVGRDYRWQVGLGVGLVRFRSSVYFATAVGLNSSLSYFINDSLAIEGAVTSAFAPAVFESFEHVKYVGYGAGPKFTFGRDKLQPWVHALVGGAHILPQTGLGSQNGFEVLVGGGVDYAIHPSWALRLEGDYVRTQLFGQSQNNGQAVLGIVYRF